MKCTLQIEVEYDEKITTPEDVASAMDTLLESALSTEGVLGEEGCPQFGFFEVASRLPQPQTVDDLPIASCPQHRAFKAFIMGSALAGSAMNTEPELVVVQRAVRIAEEAMQELS